MAGVVKGANLQTAKSRGRLKGGRMAHWHTLVPGKLHVGYQRWKGEPEGRWLARRYLGIHTSASGRPVAKYSAVTLGRADDAVRADGDGVLNFEQASAKARAVVEDSPPAENQDLTVQQACDSYIEYLRAHKKTADDAEGRLKKHILPYIGTRLVIELTTADIEKCHRAMVRIDDGDPETERRSKDSANRVLSSLKAALARVFADESNNIPFDAAWRRVKPFKGVGRARQVHLDVAQSNRLINSTSGRFRWLVTAALLTGARAPHELAQCRVRDFRADLGTLSIDGGKTGARDIVLTREAIQFFKDISAGGAPDDLLLPKDDGSVWGKSHHTRDMIEAVKRAKLPKGCTIYSLRHTYASQSLLAGMNIKLLAENMGTSIRMIELHYGKFLAAARRKLVEESGFKLGLRLDRKIVAL